MGLSIDSWGSALLPVPLLAALAVVIAIQLGVAKEAVSDPQVADLWERPTRAPKRP